MESRSFALGLGGNLGDVRGTMKSCITILSEDQRISGLRISSLYRTPPWGGVQGGEFLNSAVSGMWLGTDIELLHLCQSIEGSFSVPVNKNGAARILDIDVLFLESGISSEELTLPHPGLIQRKFVLVPLCEVWVDAIPGLGETPSDFLKRAQDCSSIIFQGDLYSP
ncbi:MAG: 2-amino-4-hydroxy-6-hydroxymethyldihydropteridine diphosphokinase [Candidatus Sabulitectum sp.]|nr:2-amino-4-hydroxy-6-hydroxymethyldihydropteridine diphosphokinase [Candidatus Sabulitectum sp.]